MTEWTLEATIRESRGKNEMRRLRSTGQVPAVIYGLHDPQAIQVPAREASRLVQMAHGTSRMITLRLAESAQGQPTERQVLLKEVQTTPVGNRLLHLDFNEIDVEAKVRMTVEVRPIGTAAGVTLGGTMQTVMHELVVECLPTNMPQFIEADVSELEIGHSIHVADLIFPPGVEPVSEGSTTVIVISGQMKEEVEEVAEELEEGVEGEIVAEAEGEGETPAKDAPAEES